MRDKTIDNALLAPRKQIIRGDGEGLERVEALLRMRSVPMPSVLPHRCPTTARRNVMRHLVLDALRDGSKKRRQLVDWIAPRRPDVTPERLYWRVDAALSKVHAAGLVRREGRVWRLAP